MYVELFLQCLFFCRKNVPLATYREPLEISGNLQGTSGNLWEPLGIFPVGSLRFLEVPRGSQTTQRNVWCLVFFVEKTRATGSLTFENW